MPKGDIVSQAVSTLKQMVITGTEKVICYNDDLAFAMVGVICLKHSNFKFIMHSRLGCSASRFYIPTLEG